MKKFIVLYHAPPGAVEERMKNSTPDQMKEGMAQWQAWAQRAGEKLVDMGSPLSCGGTVGKEDASCGCGTIAGFSVMQGENINDVKELLKDHPHLNYSEKASIEVHEQLPMPE